MTSPASDIRDLLTTPHARLVLAVLVVLGVVLTVMFPSAAPLPAFAATLLAYGTVRARLRHRDR